MASTRRRRFIKLLILTVVAGAVGGGAYLYTHRHTFRVVVRPGQSKQVAVEVPMRRLGRRGNTDEKRALQVDCTVKTPRKDDGVRLSVVHTGHADGKLQARVYVATDPTATPGRRKRRVSFTVADEGGWPKATVVVDVRE